MADALTVLRHGHSALPKGIVIPEVMIRAAQMENVDLAVAAAILEGESGGGRNIWGADGGLNVRTNGTYKPRTTVTRDAYLAYRAEMRAKRIIRQGAGPCQCTSSQYQDTADALGGTWDPLANCRSGFRGMGALIRAHGVRGGSRRYNGAGAPAEAYATRFVVRYDRWRVLLSGVSIPTVTVPAATPAVAVPPVREETDVLVQAAPVITTDQAGVRYFRAVVKAEAGAGSVFSAAWACVNATWGDLSNVRVFSLDGKGGARDISPKGGRVANNTEFAAAVPVGARFVTVEGRLSSPTTIVTVSSVSKPA